MRVSKLGFEPQNTSFTHRSSSIEPLETHIPTSAAHVLPAKGKLPKSVRVPPTYEKYLVKILGGYFTN